MHGPQRPRQPAEAVETTATTRTTASQRPAWNNNRSRNGTHGNDRHSSQRHNNHSYKHRNSTCVFARSSCPPNLEMTTSLLLPVPQTRDGPQQPCLQANRPGPPEGVTLPHQRNVRQPGIGQVDSQPAQRQRLLTHSLVDSYSNVYTHIYTFFT